MSDDILFEKRGRAAIVTLDREAALNAVTGEMIDALAHHLDEWEADPSVAHVVIRARGKAFSVGGDIRALYESRHAPDLDFFRREYRLNARIKHFSKPYVALVHGLVMGGGVGVSLHGSHVVAGPKMAFAMPEVGIGFFPDVGATFLLPRLPRNLGMELGLTGRRLDADECLAAGLATHGADDLDDVLERLTMHDVATALAPFERAEGAGPPRADDVFAQPDVASIILAAERLGSGLGDTLKAKSPTSLAIAHRQLSQGASLDFDAAMRLEFRIVSRILHGHDFYEGIRAQVIDKDRKPRWRPATIADVDPAAIAAHFAPLDEELEL